MHGKPRSTCQGCLLPRHLLVPVRSGLSFQIVSPPDSALVSKAVAHELERVLERFGRIVKGPTAPKVAILFKPGIFGHHHVGRAVDIYEVGGIGLDVWKQRWDEGRQRAAMVIDPAARAAILKSERRQNMGWLLYKTLQHFGRWAKPAGYPIQLFGPWTRSEGPWKYISNFLLHAHRDHIHVAK
jgi:hypothetical protein